MICRQRLSSEHVKQQVVISVNFILIMDIITEIFTVGRAFDSQEARGLAACAFTSGEVMLTPRQFWAQFCLETTITRWTLLAAGSQHFDGRNDKFPHHPRTAHRRNWFGEIRRRNVHRRWSRHDIAWTSTVKERLRTTTGEGSGAIPWSHNTWRSAKSNLLQAGQRC